MGTPKDRDQRDRERTALREAGRDKSIDRELKRAQIRRLNRRSSQEDWTALAALLIGAFVLGAIVVRLITF